MFSDGEKFDANAVKANFDAIMDNKDRHGWLESVRLFNKFEVVDENTFKIYLNEPYFRMMIELGVIDHLDLFLQKHLKMEQQKME